MPPSAHMLLLPHVTETLAKAVASHSLVVLTAPMGYGKTTAVRNLLQQLCHVRQFVITIPAGGHNAFYLWDIAHSQLAAQGVAGASQTQHMGFPENQVTMQRMFQVLDQNLGQQPTLIVLDDYHLVTAPEVDAFIEALVRRKIPGLCILLVSRCRPHIQLEEMRLKGIAAVFGQSLLTFSRKDIAEYFAKYGVHDKKIVQAAWVFSEGWAAALWLSLENYLAHGAIKPTQNMDKLLEETVFANYLPENKKLLLQLAVLESFTAEQATQLSGDTAAPVRLRQLHDQNAFLTYDKATNIYRMHSIFRTFLLHRLPEKSSAPQGAIQPGATGGQAPTIPIDTTALYRRAGELLAKTDDKLQAIRFFFHAGREEDLLRILELFTLPSTGMFVKFDPQGLVTIMQSIPWKLRKQCPMGYLTFICHYLSKVDREAGLQLLEEMERLCSAEEECNEEQRQRLQGEIELILAVGEFNDLPRVFSRYKRAHALLQGRSCIATNQLVWTFGLPHIAFSCLCEPGSYKQLVDLVEQNLHYYQEMTGGCSAGGQDLFHAEHLLETGDLHNVEYYLTKASYRATLQNQLTTLVAVGFTRARYLMALGEAPKTKQVFDALTPCIEQAGQPLQMNFLSLCQGYIAAVNEEKENIPPWVQQGDLSVLPFQYQSSPFVQIVHGKSLVLARDWASLGALTEYMPTQAGSYTSVFIQLHTLLMQSIVTYNVHGLTKATPLLSEAIALARPDAIVCTIAEYGKHIYPLLVNLWEWHPNDLFLKTLIVATKRYTRVGSAGHSPLAPREQAILERAKQGLNNQEIGQALGITAASVANTLSRVYAKLGVKNRANAIKVWQEIKTGK